MKKNYRAELVGVFGDPVDDNPTGVMEEAGFRAKGLNYRYITAKVLPEALGAAIAGARAMHMKGFNLTMPHKVRVIPFLDGVTNAARIAGMTVGLVLCYAFGTAWFMVVYARTGGAIGLGAALSMCVLPFILPDCAKIALAAFVSARLKPRLKR